MPGSYYISLTWSPQLGLFCAVAANNNSGAALPSVKLSYQSKTLEKQGDRLINGGFSVDQRKLTSVSASAYHLDRWYALTQSGSVTVAQQVDQEVGRAFNLRLTQPDGTAKRIGTAQAIEARNIRDLRNSSVALQARVRCSSSQPIRYAVIEWTGTADAPSKNLVNNWTSTDFSMSGFFTSTTAKLVLCGKVTPTANTWTSLFESGELTSLANNVTVFFWTEGTLAQNGTLDIGTVSLVPGIVPTAIATRPYGEELALCRRYLPAFNAGTGDYFADVGYCTSTSGGTVGYSFDVEPRVKPTSIAVTAVGNFSAKTATITAVCNALTLDAGTTLRRGRITWTSATTTFTSANPCEVFANTNTQILFNGCEL